jgi:hypothetical protein
VGLAGHGREKASREMATLKLTLWYECRDPGESGVQLDGTRFSFEDLDAITSREEAQAAGIPTVLLEGYHGKVAAGASIQPHSNMRCLVATSMHVYRDEYLVQKCQHVF